MRVVSHILLLAAALTAAACGSRSDEPATGEAAMPNSLYEPFAELSTAAPVAEKRPVEIEQHGETRIDDYAWMRDENWQEVLRDPSELDADIHEHLDAENA